MDPRIRIGAVVIGIVLILGAKLFASLRPRFPTNTGDTAASPSWVGQYIIAAFGAMFVVGGLMVGSNPYGGAFAVLSFVVVLFALSGYRVVKDVRAGGHGGEEEPPAPPAPPPAPPA